MEKLYWKNQNWYSEGEDEEIVEMIDEVVEAGVSPKEIVHRRAHRGYELQVR